ncbi:MAG TPA: protein-disulfide reductase DsbD domain-containing protein [Verrucomicrobiae bacterium]|jgi:thiol:disulfide interchange protein DsbD|nr:protein-disulfide reductase DsbD domain-containing protein [Verrucomicrobiae bacterium]
MIRWFTVAAFLAALPVLAFNKTQTRLVLSDQTAPAGATVWAGLEMKMPPGWHTYWRNGGDAGSPTTIDWHLPKGVTAGDVQWPIPHKMVEKISDETTLVTYIYSNTVVLLVPLRLEAGLAPGKLEISGTAHWQECADICVMAKDDVSATLTIGSQEQKSSDADLIAQWQARLPGNAAAPAAARWDGPAKGEIRRLILEWRTNAPPADFYPFANADFDVQGLTEILPGTPDRVQLRKAVKKSDGTAWPARVAGMWVGRAETATAFAMEADMSVDAPGGVVAKPAEPPRSLWAMLGFALLGGLILNVMPCVLPVIALKILGFVNQSQEHPGRVRQLGFVYGLGVLVSFLILALLAVGVQKAGGVANWGDAIRNPQFQVIVTVLITLVALNLFGVFEVTLSGRALGAATGLASRQGLGGAFFNGALATALATPCTAPFLAPALAFAFTQPPVVIVEVFLAAGLGLALPFVIICLQPRSLRFLPKPGAWMVRFKVAMGFPMMATAVWLAWVAAREPDDVLWLGLFLVIVALAAWIWGEFVQRGAARRGLAGGIGVALLLLGYFGILEGPLQWRRPIGQAKPGIAWQAWSDEAVEQARRAGHPALVDFTAKSCLNCKVNKASSIEIAPTREKLKEINAVAFEADYTHEDPAIARTLQKYDRPGVPLVLVYPKDATKPPEVLPPILTPSIVLAALDAAGR